MIGERPMTPTERQQRRRERLKASQEISMSHAENTNVEALRIPPPLPETRSDLLAQYKLKRKRNINDLVEDIVIKIWEDEDFQKYIEAIYDSEAVTGSKDDDTVMAALMIKQYAEKNGHVEVAAKNLHTVKLAMCVVLRCFNQGRSDRFEAAELPAPSSPPPQHAAAE